MEVENCPICKKHKENKDVIYKDDVISIKHLIRHPDKADNYLGYYMIESLRHFRGMYDTTAKEMEAVGSILKYLSQAMMIVLNAAHVYAFIIGEGLEHFHIHVVARYKNAPREYWGASVDDWPEAPRGSIKDIRELNGHIRIELLRVIDQNEE